MVSSGVILTDDVSGSETDQEGNQRDMSGEIERKVGMAIMAHPDDAELACGGTLVRAAEQGYRTGVLDLTAGETGTWGNASIRATEADRAAEVLGLTARANAGLPDGKLRNTNEARTIVAAHIRTLRPSTVILHGPNGRHPDRRGGTTRRQYRGARGPAAHRHRHGA
jgi:LmbE family N-acetylglucosaminyl deacetylase